MKHGNALFVTCTYLLIFSALLYALAFIYSTWLWWLVFVYAIPLFYAASMYRLTAWHGLLWGSIFFTVQSAGVGVSLYHMATGPWYMCIVPGLLIVGYLTLFPVVLFGLLDYVARSISPSHVVTLILWTGGLCGMTSIIDWYCFIPLGTMQGYTIMNPLIPLVTYPQLLRLVPYLGVEVMMLLLLAVAATITACIIYRSYTAMCCALLVSLPWLIVLCLPMRHTQAPTWLSRIAVLPIVYPTLGNGAVAAQSLLHDLSSIVHQHPSVDIVIVPESALTGLLIDQLCQRKWPERCAQVHLIAGSNSWMNGRYCNCALWIKGGERKACFAKRRLIPPIEYMPRACSGLHSLYFSCNIAMEPSDNERPCFKLDATMHCVPYICSELFLSVAPDDTYESPLILLVHDAWCKAEYLVQCMYLCARFKAIAWQRDVVYASFFHAAWLSTTGDAIPLIRA